AGDVFDPLRLLRITAATNRRDGRPAVRVLRHQAPGAIAAHRQASKIDSFRINLIFLLNFREDRQSALGLGRIAPPGSLLRLREDGNKAEVLFALLDCRPETDLCLLVAVRARLAGAVQKEDQRVSLVALIVVRHEEDILRLAAVTVLVN